MSDSELEALITGAFDSREKLSDPSVRQAIETVIARLDEGALRVASQEAPGRWVTHAWVKQAILLYFAIRPMEKLELPPFE